MRRKGSFSLHSTFFFEDLRRDHAKEGGCLGRKGLTKNKGVGDRWVIEYTTIGSISMPSVITVPRVLGTASRAVVARLALHRRPLACRVGCEVQRVSVTASATASASGLNFLGVGQELATIASLTTLVATICGT
jgi:hypothetical protein